MRNKWQLQEAKNQLSRVVESAITDGAQVITRHGEPAVVILSIADYQKLRSDRKSVVDILRSCPVPDFPPEALRDTPSSNPL